MSAFHAASGASTAQKATHPKTRRNAAICARVITTCADNSGMARASPLAASSASRAAVSGVMSAARIAPAPGGRCGNTSSFVMEVPVAALVSHPPRQALP